MRRNLPVVTDACHLTRTVCLTALAMAVAGLAVGIAPAASHRWVLGGVLVVLAGQIGWLVYRSVRHLAHREASLRQASAEAEAHYVDVLRRVVHFTEARDRFTVGHSQRVGELAGQIARKLGLDDRAVAQLRQAGELHDIGLVAISDELLNEKSLIAPDAFRRVQAHSEIGYEVLRPLGSLEPILPAVRHHHERMNGTGYPDALAGEQIPLAARILGVADSFDAMTHNRPHRPAMTRLNAIRELRRCSPAGYCADCVAALAEVFHVTALEETLEKVAPAALDTMHGQSVGVG